MKTLSQICVGLFLTVNCSGQPSNDRQLIEKSVHTFYDWYIESVNNESYNVLIRAVKGANGMTTLDSKTYINKLQSLGIISPIFINSEMERFRVCDDFLKTVPWEKYKQAEAYEYETQCDFFYSYFWIFSQESVNGIKIKSVAVGKEISTAQLTFILNENGKEVALDSYDIHVRLEKEGNEWLINKIERK